VDLICFRRFFLELREQTALTADHCLPESKIWNVMWISCILLWNFWWILTLSQGFFNSNRTLNSKYCPALSEVSLNEIHFGCKQLKLTRPVVTRRLTVKCYQKCGNYRYFLDFVFQSLLSRFYSASEILKVFIQSTYNLPCEMIKLNQGSNEKRDRISQNTRAFKRRRRNLT